MQPSHVERGRWAETLAAAFLCLRGYRILERNFRYSRLEIDLIAQKGNVVAVVEVKYRERPAKGGAMGAVGVSKQRDLETAAVGYLRFRGRIGLRIRFDVVTVEAMRGDASAVVVRHLPGAFQATGRYRV
jgi:putative endonuclease